MSPYLAAVWLEPPAAESDVGDTVQLVREFPAKEAALAWARAPKYGIPWASTDFMVRGRTAAGKGEVILVSGGAERIYEDLSPMPPPLPPEPCVICRAPAAYRVLVRSAAAPVCDPCAGAPSLLRAAIKAASVAPAMRSRM